MKYQMLFEEYCDTKDWVATLLVDRYDRDCLDYGEFFAEIVADANCEDVEITDVTTVDYEKILSRWLYDSINHF